MSKAKRIFFVTETKNFTGKLLLVGLRKHIKGFIRLGHDTQIFSYKHAFLQAGPVMSRKFAKRYCKSHVVDQLLIKQIKHYNPDIIYVTFANYLDVKTIQLMRQAAPNAFFIGIDVDLWPQLHKNRVQATTKLDLTMTTFSGKGLDAYNSAGVKTAFMPNSCDPDIEYRHDVGSEWKSEIIFTGQSRYKHKLYPTEDTRHHILTKLANMPNCKLYGCCGRPKIGGINYFYAISGARIGLSANAANDISLYHSDRFTQYLACGTLVLAKRVPDSELLFKDKIHLRYFDTTEEFFELAKWYLAHEDERIKIANAGMEYAHAEFNCEKIAKYTMDLIENGSYSAPWTTYLTC